VFVISPDKKIKLIIAYPNVTGRNFDELLRVLDSLQLTTRHRVVTPANWKRGEDVMIANSVSDGETKVIFGAWKSPKPYIRIVPQPDSAGSRDESSSPPNPAPRITTRARSRRAGR
jgi:thioredoxin-dependent peroxiredoxin